MSTLEATEHRQAIDTDNHDDTDDTGPHRCPRDPLDTGLLVDGEVVLAGQVPSSSRLREILAPAG